MQDTNAVRYSDPFLYERSHATELFLIRHGDALPGPAEIIPSGMYNNLPLSNLGRLQARQLTERLQTLRFDAAYCSPLLRCQETAAPFLAQTGLTPTIVESIKEVRLRPSQTIPIAREGDDLSDLARAIRESQRANSNRAAIEGNWDSAMEDDTSKAFRARVVEAIDMIGRQHRGQRVAIFSHGGVINVYVAEVLGLERDFFFPCANTSITVVRVHDTQRVLYILNDIAHLTKNSANS